MDRKFTRVGIGRIAMLASLVGVIGGGVVTTAAHAKDIVIGLSMKTHAQRRWSFDEQLMQAEANKLGVKLIFQWANDSPTTQASQFENLLSQNVDAIVIVPIDAAAAGPLIDEAHQQKVPVVSYDVDIGSAKLDYKVTRDNAAVGVLQANAAMKFAPKGNYALIEGDPANNVARAIAEEHKKIFGTDKDINIVYNQFTTDWDPKTAQSVAENTLSAQNDNIAAFVTANDGMGSGAAQAISGRNLQGKVFISGLDADNSALQLIAQGVQTMTVWTDLKEQDADVIDAAAALAQGKQPSLTSVMTDDGAGPYPMHKVAVTAITKDNLCDFINKVAPAGWVSVADVFPDKPDACK